MSYTKKLLLTCLSLAMVGPVGAGTGRNLLNLDVEKPSKPKSVLPPANEYVYFNHPNKDTKHMCDKLAELKAQSDVLSDEKTESAETGSVPVVTLKITGPVNHQPKIMFTDDGKVLYHTGRKSFPFWTSEYTGVLMEESDLSSFSGTTTVQIKDSSERYSPGELAWFNE